MIFSLVVKISLIRFMLSLVVFLDLEVEKMDAKRTFFHGDWEEETYMKNLDG